MSNTLSKTSTTPNTSKSDEDIFDRLDKENRLLAQKMKAYGLVTAGYSVVDGGYYPYSFLKLYFEVFFGKNSSDAMHEWLLTSQGAAEAATLGITFVTFAMLANQFINNNVLKEGSDANALKKYIAITWPYVRDGKGLKNTVGGTKRFLALLKLFNADLQFLMLPIGLSLGVLTVANRLWYRNMKNKRKKMMDDCDTRAAQILKRDAMTAEEYQAFCDDIPEQSMLVRTSGLAAATFDGVVSSLYLYVGVLLLCSVPFPVLAVMAACCFIYSMANIATKAYEEYDYQAKLLIKKKGTELIVLTKQTHQEMQAELEELEQIQAELLFYKTGGNNKDSALSVKAGLIKRKFELIQSMETKISLLKAKRSEVASLAILSNASALLAGSKNALAVYGALSTAMIALSAICSLASITLPALLVMSAVLMGMVFLVLFSAYSLWVNALHRNVHEQTADMVYAPLTRLLQQFKVQENRTDLKPAKSLGKVLEEGAQVKGSPQSVVQPCAEVLRAAGSGFNKASNISHTILEESDGQGHYHDTPLSQVVGLVSSLIYVFFMAMQAHIKGFSKDPSKEIKIQLEKEVQLEKEDCPTKEVSYPRGASAQGITKPSPSYGFFQSYPSPAQKKQVLADHEKAVLEKKNEEEEIAVVVENDPLLSPNGIPPLPPFSRENSSAEKANETEVSLKEIIIPVIQQKKENPKPIHRQRSSSSPLLFNAYDVRENLNSLNIPAAITVF